MSGREAKLAFEPAGGTFFYTLGEQGILFDERRQELHLLDSAASYVWCSVQDGLSFAEIVADYGDACGLPVAQAGAIVGELLHRWLGLGYIRGDDAGLPPCPVDFTTALGRLLVNPALREAFASDPRATARRVGLRNGDADIFADIEPAQLERLADLADAPPREDRRSILPADEAACRSAVMRYQTREWSLPSATRHYRIAGLTLRVGFDTNGQEESVHGAFEHLATTAASAEMSFQVIAESAGHVILKDGQPAGFCAKLDRLAWTVLVLIREVLFDRADCFIGIHAAVVSTGDACVLLPAASGSGKSTLAAALARSGFQFFTDEIAMLDEGTMQARPVPFPVVVKDGSVAPLTPWYPELADLAISRRDNDQPVRFMTLHPSSMPAAGEDRLPVRWIVFPRYDAAAETVMRSIPPEEAFARILGENSMINARLDAGNVTAMIDWFRGLDCYDLALSSLPDAIDLVKRLCSPAAAPAP